MEVVKKRITEIVPYKNNPRMNENAVDAVMESIRQCGYVAPIILDENNVILAGHTRLKALKQLGYDKVDVIVRNGLTEEQKRKYRILDNKTNEFADWDFTKLEKELAGLDFEGFDFDFGELEDLIQEIEEPVFKPTFTPEGVSYTNEQDDDPYLPEDYDDEDIQEYTKHQEEYIAKKRVIITFYPQYEPDVKALLRLEGEMKVVYDIEELLNENNKGV